MPRRKSDSTAVEQEANNPDVQEADAAFETIEEQDSSETQELATDQNTTPPDQITSSQEVDAQAFEKPATKTEDENSGPTGEADPELVQDQEAIQSPASKELTTQADKQAADASNSQEQVADQLQDDTASSKQPKLDSKDGKPVKPKSTKPKKERVVTPKQEFTMILDGGRSQIKVLVLLENEVVSTLVLESTICQVEAPPFGELGAFSTSRDKIEVDGKQKDLVESWIVGTSAKLQGKDYIAMSDGEDNKITYFPILALGAIASLPNLYELSTGSNDTNRSLSIKLVTLSLANPMQLKEAIKKCKWLKVDGIKYSLSFSKEALNYPEGYGAALHGQGENRATRPVLFTFDVGFGTACVSEYNNLGKLPKRVSHKPNGGGGVATLIREFAEAIANSDSVKVIKPSQLREILSTAAITENGEVYAVAPDGRNVGSALEIAIRTWVKDSPLTFALESLGIQARKHPVVLCGGGFAIPPVQKIVKESLVNAGIPEKNLLVPERPEIVSLVEMKKLYVAGSDVTDGQTTPLALEPEAIGENSLTKAEAQPFQLEANTDSTETENHLHAVVNGEQVNAEERQAA